MKKYLSLMTCSFVIFFTINSFATTVSTIAPKAGFKEVSLDISSKISVPAKGALVTTAVVTNEKTVSNSENSLRDVDSDEEKMKEYHSINIAVASNFKVTAQYIADKFTEQFAIKVNISSASTATLYQQILRGAPFDIFLSADKKHTQLLNGDNRFIYAQGHLAFWMPAVQRKLTLDDFKRYTGRLAIGNPKFAPYGIAAKEALEFSGKWHSLQYIKGNNISQTYQFIDTGNVPAGLVSYATIIQKQQQNHILIPQSWYQPIQQEGIILNNKNMKESNLFRQFILSESIQLYIKSQGYN